MQCGYNDDAEPKAEPEATLVWIARAGGKMVMVH